MNEEKIEVGDVVELAEQNKKAILESGKYCSLEIIVGMGNDLPYCNVNLRNCSVLEIGALVKVAREECKLIEEKIPDCVMTQKMFGIKEITITERDKKDGTENM